MRRGDAGGRKVGAFAVDGMIEVLGEWIVDDADKRLQLVGEGQGDGDIGMSVHKVGGSVDGVDYEGWGRGEAAGCGCFFA